MFKQGNKVAVINQKLNGQFFVESTDAYIVKPTDVEGQYIVRFVSSGDFSNYPRFVDMAAQADPHGFVAKLNAQTSAA